MKKPKQPKSQKSPKPKRAFGGGKTAFDSDMTMKAPDAGFLTGLKG